MRNKTKWLAVALCLSMFATMAMGSGSSGESTTTKVGEVESADSGESSSDETQVEEKTEYHVGDILKDGDVQIVYVASGEYQEDNEYSQPEDGNKFIFIKLAFENQGDSDESVSYYSFEGYADGYNVDMHYTDDDLSATLSPGRTTDGTLVFEVPEDAQEIEIEYETNFFTEDKIKFIYDGDKDSGYVAEANTEASEDAYVVGDIVESSDLNISYLSCENDTSYSQYSAPESGYHYVTLTFEFENIGNDEEYVSYFDFDCYADGKDCEMAYFRDDGISATLSAGRKAQGTVTFTVPDDATTIEVEYVANAWTGNRVVFTVSE